MNSGVEVALRQDGRTARQRPTSLAGSSMSILSTMISSGKSSSWVAVLSTGIIIIAVTRCSVGRWAIRIN
jgi:hypothetical protein